MTATACGRPAILLGGRPRHSARRRR
jgi:hypothetical protein